MIAVCLLHAGKRFEEVRQYLQPDVVIVNTVHPFNPQPNTGVSTLTGVDEARHHLTQLCTEHSSRAMLRFDTIHRNPRVTVAYETSLRR